MYNGIGLQTARGSGTNGYVQTNKFFVRPKTGRVTEHLRGFEDDQGTAGVTKKANKDILEHDRKRQIEIKLVVLEDKLTDQGYTDAEIAEKLEEARSALLAAAALEDSGGAVVSNEKLSETQTHQVAARKEKQMETLRAALGISVSGPEDALDLEPGEIKNEQPKNSRKYGRNEGGKGREKSSDGNGEKEFVGGKKLDDKYKRPEDDYSNSEIESDQETRIKSKSKSRKHKRREGDSSNSETDSEHEPRKSKSKSRKQKRRSDNSSDMDSDGKKVRRSRNKSKRASKDAESDSDYDTLKKLDAKRRRRTSDSSDSDSAEKLKKRSKKKARHISKDIDSDSTSEDRSSFSDSSDSDTRKDKTRHVSKHISQSSRGREGITSNSKKQANKKQQYTSESDSDDRVAVTQKRRPVQQQRHDTDNDDSGSADDENAQRNMAARKLRSKNADDTVVGDNKRIKSYKEEEGRWEDHINDGKHHGENKNEDGHIKRDKTREQENPSERMHDRYEDARNHRNDKFVVDRIDGERHGQKNGREPMVMRRSGSDRHEDNRENRQSDRFEEPRDKRLSDRNPEKIKDGNLIMSQVSDPERRSKRDEYDGRLRNDEEDENRHVVRKMHSRGEEREEAGRRHGRGGGVDSPKRARYDDDSRRYDRSRR